MTTVNGTTGDVIVWELIGSGIKMSIRPEVNYPGINAFVNEAFIGAIRYNELIENSGFLRLEEINKEGNAVAVIFTSVDPPPYPVTSVNGHTGNVKINSIQNFISYAPGTGVPDGLTLIYNIPILTTGTLPKGNTMYVRLVTDKTSFEIVPVSCSTETQPYIQCSCCILNNGVGMTFTSEAVEGSSTPFSARLLVFSTVPFTIMSLEV